jgi:hypothetical protein
MQAVIDQKDGRRSAGLAAIAGELPAVLQTDGAAVRERNRERAIFDRIAARVGMRAGCERHGLIEKAPRPGDDKLAARRIVALHGRRLRIPRNGIGAVERIVERTPARIGGVERVTRIADRHHKLRPGNGGDLCIDVGGVDLEVRSFRHEIADLGEECLLRGNVGRLPAPLAIPGVDLGLQFIAPREQRPIARRKIVDDAIKPAPESRWVDGSARNHFVHDEIVQDLGYFQISNRYAIESGHKEASMGWIARSYRAERGRLCMKYRPPSMG